MTERQKEDVRVFTRGTEKFMQRNAKQSDIHSLPCRKKNEYLDSVLTEMI